MKERSSISLHWAGDWPWYFSVGLAVVLGLVAFFLYRRDARTGLTGAVLPILRAVAIFLLVLMLSGPVIHHRKVIGELARVLVCLDASESMQLTDASMDVGRKIAIARRLGWLEGVNVPLELPTASEKLEDARGIAASVAAINFEEAREPLERARNEFVSRVREAAELFAKGAPDAREHQQRFETELARPTENFSRAELNTSGERSRVAVELERLGLFAARWSREFSDLFQRDLAQKPDAGPLTNALAKFDKLPRWQRLQALLLEGNPQQRMLAELAKSHDVQVLLLENGTVKSIWQSGSESTDVPAALPAAQGEVTNLTSALKFATAGAERVGKGAVLILSDGQHNAGEPPADAARILGDRKLPVFTIGFGSKVPPRDLAVVRTVVPDAVFHEDRIRGEVFLKEEVPAGQTFTLTFKDGDKTIWEQQLVTEGRALRRVAFEFGVKELAEARLRQSGGIADYEVLGAPIDLKVVVSGLEGDRELSNNEGTARFRAVTQKRKILIVDGRPRWETRYLKNLFERDEKWEVSAVTAGSTNEVGFIRGEKPGTFPSDAKLLDAFDLIIFGEVPKSVLRDEELKWIADFVAKRGGALLLIDGPRGVLRQYADTPIGPLIPVEWQAGARGMRENIKGLELSERAAGLPAFALSTDLSQNAATWSKLPAPHWLSGALPLAGAEVLIRAEVSGTKIAAAAMQSFGAGRVYYQGYDDSWRWRFEVADLYHTKFWNQLASFVAEAPFSARDKFVQIDAGKVTYEPGEQADFRVRLRDLTGKPVTDAAVSAVLSKGGNKVASIALTPDEGGLYRGKTAALDPGDYEMRVESAAVPEGQLKARTQFKVAAGGSSERTMLALNEDLMRAMSVATGGEYFREEHADQVLSRLAPLSEGNVEVSDTRLNESWWWFGIIVALLTIEWIVRKRAGML